MTREPTRTERRESVAALLRQNGFELQDAPEQGDGFLIVDVGYRSLEQAEGIVGIGAEARAAHEPAFDPLTHHTSKASDLDLAGYLVDRLGLTQAEIRIITTMLGCDGAAHEVWEELVARRRRAGR